MADNEELLKLAGERFKIASEADQVERVEADMDVRFALDDEGCQWPEITRGQREGDFPPRPCLSLNKIPEKIDIVDGEFKNLKPSFKIRAVDSKADPKIADIYGGLLRHIEYNSQARAAYNTAYTSCLYSGRGAWRIDVEDDEDDPFVRTLRINRIPNVLSVYWDPDSKKLDKSDARYIFVTDIVGKEQFEADYPDVELDSWPDGETWDTWKSEQGIRVAEYWYKEMVTETYYRVRREMNGLPMAMTVKEPRFDDQIIEEKEIKRPRVKWCKMIANKVIDGPHDDWPSRFIPIVLAFGKENNVRGRSKTRGMVRFARTPQQMYNYWSSSITEQIALAPKSPYLVTAKQIGPYKGQWDQAHIKNYPYLLWDVDDDAPGLMPRREPPPPLSSAVAHELQRMDRDIMAAMGIYEASLGADTPQDRSGVAILARQRQGNISSAPYIENFHLALTYSTRVLIDLIPHVYDTERVVRIIGSDDVETSVPINARPNAPILGQIPVPNGKFLAMPKPPTTEYLNDLTVGKYDVVVDIGPSYTTQRQEALQQLIELAQVAPNLAQGALDIIVENMDLPHGEKLLQRAKKLVPIDIQGLDEGEAPPPPPTPDPLVMLSMKELELKAMDQQLKAREQDRKEFDTQVTAILNMAKAESLARETQMNQIMTTLETLKTHFDAVQGQEQLRLQGRQLQQDQMAQIAEMQQAGQPE